MAHLQNPMLFFTTSPRTPSKMIPEIKLLHDRFEGRQWNKMVQEDFSIELANSDFFEGFGSTTFSARDRITRSPKALGFVNLSPGVQLTDAGKEFIFGKRPHETLLRQLVKFQIPSPYHGEAARIRGTFNVKPYLEVMRLVSELGYLAFDELIIFGLRMTNYQMFDEICREIRKFRYEKLKNKGQYRAFKDKQITAAIRTIFKSQMDNGDFRIRGSISSSERKFFRTKAQTMRDYADACFRYLRYTELFEYDGKSLRVSKAHAKDLDFILRTVEREPIPIGEQEEYLKYLQDPKHPILYADNRDGLIDKLMRIGGFTRREITSLSLDKLKDLLSKTVAKNKQLAIDSEITQIKSFALYSEIDDTFNEIIDRYFYDGPLMFEYNTWRAMTMLNGGKIIGHFTVDDSGKPLSTAPGKQTDIECSYGDFVLSVEVTLQSGAKQYEAEGEPVARHLGELRERTNKPAYCLFISPVINKSTLAHFWNLNQINTKLYGGKTSIVPLNLAQFRQLLETSYNNDAPANPSDIRYFLDSALESLDHSEDEDAWAEALQDCVNNWLK